MVGLAHAIDGLSDAVRQPTEQSWGWLVRQRMTVVRRALYAEPAVSESWLAARASCVLRTRNQLLARLSDLGPMVLAGEKEDVRQPLERLLADLERHRQRLSDLVYDSVELELGGSE